MLGEGLAEPFVCIHAVPSKDSLDISMKGYFDWNDLSCNGGSHREGHDVNLRMEIVDSSEYHVPHLRTNGYGNEGKMLTDLFDIVTFHGLPHGVPHSLITASPRCSYHMLSNPT